MTTIDPQLLQLVLPEEFLKKTLNHLRNKWERKRQHMKSHFKPNQVRVRTEIQK
jgi:hypothetical protein